MDGADCQAGGVQGVNAQVRRPAGVSAPADKADFLGHGAVIGAADAELPFLRGAGGVNHHCQVHIVKLAQLDQFRLAAQELNLALPPQFIPVFNFNIFLGGNGNQGNAAAEVGQHFRLIQADGRAQQHPNLAVMAAGVGGSGFRVGVGMFVDNQGIQFPQQGHRRAGAAAPQIGPHPGQAQAGAERQPHFRQLAGYQLGGLDFPIARLRVLQDGLGQGDNFVGPGVNGGEHPAFQFLAGQHIGDSFIPDTSE